MSSRSVLFSCLLVLTSLPAFAAPSRPPNIVYIIADDLGYGDLGSYGQKLIRTTRLDQLAREGLRFTQHYSGSASCAPSRCVLLTGKHTGHAQIRANTKIPMQGDPTFLQSFQAAGYVTGAFGKWGMGYQQTPGAPEKHGVNEYLAYLDHTDAHTYYPDHLWSHQGRREIPENRNGARRVYSHDLIAKAALDFIQRHKDRPFFLYAPFTIPHAEVAVPDDALAEYRGRWPEPKQFPGSKTYAPQTQPRAVRAAMISRLDRDVGRIVDLLDELGLAENTLVMFTSDNGPIGAGGQDWEFFDSNGPLRDLKFTLYEGGIRVPLIARWKGRIAAGRTSDHVTDFADMFPTFAELIGAKTPAGLDGVSIVPTLLGQAGKQQRRDYHYWEAAPQQAVRSGDWKLYRAAPDRPVELYNLANDIGETKNLAAAQPEIRAKLEKLLTTARTDSPDFPLDRRRGKEK